LNKPIKDITFHYTNEQMVKDLLNLTPFDNDDLALDAGSGTNKVWQKNCPIKCLECEITEGLDFLKWETNVDWVVGNPPFHISKDFFNKAVQIAQKGVAFLINTQAFNSITPKRLQEYMSRGFYINRVVVVSDVRWYGRYYYVILTKNPCPTFQWKLGSYK